MARKRWLEETACERDQKYDQWFKQMPYLPIPDNWDICMLPPFGGAAVRFRVKLKGTSDNSWISVYADFEEVLGFYWDEYNNSQPYWEIYPAAPDEDDYRATERFDLTDVNGLVSSINRALKANDL